MIAPWTVRPAEPTDVEAVYALYHRVRPCWPVAIERLAARVANPAAAALVASRGSGDPIVGYAAANLLGEGVAFCNVFVDPPHQGHGVGSALRRAVERHAAVSGAARVRGLVQDDDARSIAVLRRWGCEIVQPATGGPSEDTFALDLAAAPADPAAPPGVILGSFHGLAPSRLAHDLWPLYAEGLRDKPRWDDDEPNPDDWRDKLADDALIAHASLVALRDDRPVGFTVLTAAGPATAHVGLTVVDRYERGKGIATFLKSESIRHARRQGFHWMVTESRSDNEAINAVNQRLGFRRVRLLDAVRELATGQPSG